MSQSQILIVDDVANNLQLMGTILKSRGYHIRTASNGKEALRLIDEQKPDLILLDIIMPEMNGFETCEAIKSRQNLEDIPIIFLTGKSDADDVVKGFKLGAADYIAKPFNTAELLLRVKTQIELKQSRDQLTQKNKELHDLNISKDKFFSIISHDLKSPFQGLIGLTELLDADVDQMKPEDIRQFSKMIHESARNLLNLLENLLEWSVLELNKKHCKPEKVDIRAIVNKNINLFAPNCQKKGIKLINTVATEVTAWADLNMVDTVIRNLTSNAIKYTPEGGSITFQSNSDESFVTVDIIDTGVGMDQKTQNQLFKLEELRSQPGTSNEKGTGLGLLICRELIEKNNGQISVNSEPGKGSVFTIALPISKETATH